MSSYQTVSKDIELRQRDFDVMRHVNNSILFTYFEEGRKEFFSQVFGIVDPVQYDFILAHIRCDFVLPILIDDPIRLEIWMGKIGTKSFNFKYRLRHRTDASIVYAVAESVQVAYDYEKSRTKEVSPEFRGRVAAYQEQAS